MTAEAPVTLRAEPTATDATRIAFVMEQSLGHRSFEKSLRNAVARRDDIEATWLPISYEPGERWESLPVIRKNWSVLASIKARRALTTAARRSGSADLSFFHTHAVSLLSSGPLGHAGPVVISVDATPRRLDDFAGVYAHRRGTWLEEEVKRRLLRYVFGNASAIVAWSDWVRRSLIEEYGAADERVTVIPAGTDVAFWSPRDDEPRGVAAARPVRFLFVGGDFERKGGPLLLDVFRRQLAGACELHLVTAGDVPATRGVFVYRGVNAFSNELRDLFHQCDVFVLPTLGDASPHAIVEAMAAGLPVVATRVGAIPEVVAHGVNGFVVTRDDAAGLTRVLRRLAEDGELRARMAAESRVRATLLFDGAKNGARVLDVCRATAEEARAGGAGSRP